MPTNVTTDVIEFINFRKNVKEKELQKCIERITNYNENVVPEKNKNARETLEARKIKRANRPEKYINKAPLPEEPRVYERIDLYNNSEYLGLINAKESYEYALYCINKRNNKEVSTNLSYSDNYIKFFSRLLKTQEIRLFHSIKRLEINKKKLAENKKKNPKKYGNRPDFPAKNKEIINNERIVNHFEYIIESINMYK